MDFAPQRRPLIGLELTGRRRRDRSLLVAILAVGALLTAGGYAFGRVRLRTPLGRPSDSWAEWTSMGTATWFIPVFAAIAVLGMAFMWRRGRFPTGVTLGVSGLIALFVIATAEPSDLILEIDRVCKLGYIGLIVMAFSSILLIIVEPLNTLLERRALERHGVQLPVARVVR